MNIHAAGSAMRWYGTDFNASHARFAQRLAEGVGSQVHVCAESFAQFCARDDLPEFDFIGMHGIWTWVSEENRKVIVDFLRRKLKTGGVVYLSYNTPPGWAAMMPLRDLMNLHFRQETLSGPDEAGAADTAAGETRVHARVKAALEFARQVFATQPGYALVNPMLADRLDALSRENPHYLAHEYFNRDWQPVSFAEVAGSFDAAGLHYAGPADYRDQIDEINLTAAQRVMLEGIADPGLRETARDFCVNRSLRRDYWIKGGSKEGVNNPRVLSDDERQAALRAHRVILALPRAAVVLKVRGALGEMKLPETLYGPVLDVLADHRPATLGEIAARVQDRGIALMQVVDAATLLIGTGVLLNAQDDAQIDTARPLADRLNASICEQARYDDKVHFLVSPVSGSGVAMPRLAQLFLLARLHQLQQPAQWAAFADTALRAAPQAAHVPSMDDLIAKASRFAQIHLPVLRALGIAALHP
ncbi:class I SAM-dependent methyltransferase [Paraburkholderia sp.]|uniref:class I SAM-dependent methyltransferase n=1 Tax=Paraburkholderia sp. TaxID=1926495 RepID=UPI002F414632